MIKLRYILFSILAIFMTVLPASSAFAVDDISYSFDVNSSRTTLCDSSDSSKLCSDFNYLSYTCNVTDLDTQNLYTTFNLLVYYTNLNASTSVRSSIFPSGSLVLNNVSSVDFNGFVNVPSGSNLSCSFTLSESNPLADVSGTITIISNGTYDVSSFSEAVVNVPAPTIPSCDDPWIVRFFEGGFWNIATAVIALVVPILAIFLVFRLIHGLIFGKGV
ncbi:hypothetical protein IJJ39_01455 [Candidatus Saccharibacteria bacterium]|nr:hypothetical protein [Candidatus Saccharibacteria bacterium]